MTLLIIALSFSLGFIAGGFLRGASFENQEWMIMKWSKDALGFRPVMVGGRVFREDKIVMSLEVDSSQFDEDGTVVE
jgi:hypothetical protein